MTQPIGYYRQDGEVKPVHAPTSKRGYRATPKTRIVNSRTTRMPKELQIQLLKKRFAKLNPDVGADMIDWEAAVGKRETFHETLKDLKDEYPMYRWDKRDMDKSYDDLSAQNLRRELEGYGYKSLRKSELERISRDRRKYDRWMAEREKLKEIPGVRVNVDEHVRRWPES